MVKNPNMMLITFQLEQGPGFMSARFLTDVGVQRHSGCSRDASFFNETYISESFFHFQLCLSSFSKVLEQSYQLEHLQLAPSLRRAKK